MALIKCKECGKEISDSVKSCPHCGYVYKKEHSTIKTIIICVCTIIALVILVLIISLLPNYIGKLKGNVAIKEISGNYKLITNNELSLDENIKITQDNTINICYDGYFPPNFDEKHYGIYIIDKKKYIVTELRYISNNSDFATVFLLYDGDKLVLDHSVTGITCPHGYSENNTLSEDITIEYEKTK